MSYETFSAEKEKTALPEVALVEPAAGKNFMVAFTSDDSEVCLAMNIAINEVLDKNNLNLPDPMSSAPEGPSEPGSHAWEVSSGATREELMRLMPQIRARAEEFLEKGY